MSRPWKPGEVCPRCGKGEADNTDKDGHPNPDAWHHAKGRCYPCYRVWKYWDLQYKAQKAKEKLPKEKGS